MLSVNPGSLNTSAYFLFYFIFFFIKSSSGFPLVFLTKFIEHNIKYDKLINRYIHSLFPTIVYINCPIVTLIFFAYSKYTTGGDIQQVIDHILYDEFQHKVILFLKNCV